MTNLLDQLPKHARVSVIRLRSLGDCVLTTPALHLLKQFRPDLSIEIVVEPRFAGIFTHHPDIDSVVEQPGKADLALNLHGGTRSMWLTLATRARYRAGFAHHRYSFIYSHKIPRAQQILGEERLVHTAEHLASAMFYLGVPKTDIPRANLVAPIPVKAQKYAVLHPFASAPEKAWPAQNFARLAQMLQDTGLLVRIVAGPSDDATAFSQFQILRAAPLDEVKNLMAGASLFIGNDSGPAHIAAAFGLPVVVLFGPSNPVTWAPWKTEAQVITSPESIKTIPVMQVYVAAATLLEKGVRA